MTQSDNRGGGRRRPPDRGAQQSGRRGPPVSGVEPRRAACEIVTRVCEAHQPLAAVLDGEDSGLEPRDAALARAIARITVRRRGDIDWCLANLMDKALPKRAEAVRSILRISAAQLLFMRQADHAAVNVAVALLKGDAATGGFAGLANAVLRRLIRERDLLLARLPVEANTPGWLWERWVATYGEANAAAIAAIHREEPGLDLAFAAPSPLPEGAERLPTGGARLPAGAVTEIEGYAAGSWWVQDVAAQLPATLLGDVAGRHILDLCAAPGGKTMQLAASGARVTAVEIDAGRAARLRENLARTRLADRVDVVVGDALQAEGTYDGVLLDAPCSATGTMRRQPDVAWAKTKADITALSRVQKDLLRHAAARLAPGGSLVYATCSIEPEEGEAQLRFVAKFLPELTLEPITDGPAAAFATEEGAMRTLPHMALEGTDLRGLDGFFAARFRRN
ncbi:MFS transporter [Acuticoccus sp. M5D2P5]|uniref:RsmB/NOP family class I SAM-dependent RNA methyltransferase n=1 Tax=Acuticoccus kalidii TaxID=2910977 RepID=UPI001F295317|nr:transcription antitermination factor NusB [Acuticoccus kalidii]MCF3934158.1 MFS transporter [Acuticoccus kalidii]